MRRHLGILFAVCALAFVGACSDDDVTNSPKDAAIIVDAPAGGPDASCFTNPQTNVEIINACTTAQKIYLHPNLPLTLPDGGLPALP